MAFDLEDLGWTRPPPGNLVAFLAAGLALRRMHRRAQRGDDDEPAIRDHDAPAVTPVSASPEGENAPEAATRDGPRDDDVATSRLAANALARTRFPSDASPARRLGETRATRPTRNGAFSSVANASPGREASRGAPGDAETEARACRFCLVGDDDDDDSRLVDATRGGATSIVRDELVAPCACSGTQKWVHVGCLRRWQHVSVAHGGARRSTCAVCRRRYRVPKLLKTPRERARTTLARWFSPSAADRVASYKRTWWQIATNTVLAQDGVPRLGTPAQLAAVLAATEARIWAQREARGGNKVARALQAAAKKITDAHSAALVAWLAVLGARSLGDALGGPGGVLDGIADRLALELRRDVERCSRLGAGASPHSPGTPRRLGAASRKGERSLSVSSCGRAAAPRPRAGFSACSSAGSRSPARARRSASPSPRRTSCPSWSASRSTASRETPRDEGASRRARDVSRATNDIERRARA